MGRDGQTARGVTFEDLALFDRQVDRLGIHGLVLDPVVDLVGSATNDDRNRELRRALTPFVEWLQARRLWALGVAHTNKGTGPAITRMLGSMAWAAVPRIILGVAADPQDAQHRYLATIKNNLPGTWAETRGFRIVDGALVWDRASVDLTADQLWAPQAVTTTNATDAVTWLRDYLMDREADGVLSEAIFRDATDAGIGRNRVYEAKSTLGVRARPAGPRGKWRWSLPASAFEAPTSQLSSLAGVGREDGELGEHRRRDAQLTELPYPHARAGSRNSSSPFDEKPV